MNKAATILLAIILAWCSTVGAGAHDLDAIFDQYDQLDISTRTKFEEIDDLRALLLHMAPEEADPAGLEAIVQSALIWPDDEITVCFLDGDRSSWATVERLAGRWTLNTGVQFSFLGKCDATVSVDIRVSFLGRTSWAYIGTKARFINSSKPTMMLANMGDGHELSDNEVGTVLHEFGHALGMEHEHQRPVGGCESEIDWSFIYLRYKNRNNIETNMRALEVTVSVSGKYVTKDGELYISDFDPSSIMMYYFPERVFLSRRMSKCFIGTKNNDISAMDIDAIASVYLSGSGAESVTDSSDNHDSLYSEALSVNAKKEIDRLIGAIQSSRK